MLLVALCELPHPCLFQERSKQLESFSSDPLWVEVARLLGQGLVDRPWAARLEVAQPWAARPWVPLPWEDLPLEVRPLRVRLEMPWWGVLRRPKWVELHRRNLRRGWLGHCQQPRRGLQWQEHREHRPLREAQLDIRDCKDACCLPRLSYSYVMNIADASAKDMRSLATAHEVADQEWHAKSLFSRVLCSNRREMGAPKHTTASQQTRCLQATYAPLVRTCPIWPVVVFRRCQARSLQEVADECDQVTLRQP